MESQQLSTWAIIQCFRFHGACGVTTSQAHLARWRKCPDQTQSVCLICGAMPLNRKTGWSKLFCTTTMAFLCSAPLGKPVLSNRAGGEGPRF